MKRVLVCGAGGFIGSHLVERLVLEGNFVVGADIKLPRYNESPAHEFVLCDLTDQVATLKLFEDFKFDEVFQLAADMGGAGYLFTGKDDSSIVYNSMMINLNVVNLVKEFNIKKILFTSSACVYPEYNQLDPDNPKCNEDSVFPAKPDSPYGWEKLFAEQVYQAYSKCDGIDVKIARLHNVFGPYGSYDDGKEKAPAALCRKIANAKSGDRIEIWGPGTQTRSFLYITECIEGIMQLMESPCNVPLNIGSEYLISINDLAKLIANIANKDIVIDNIPGPVGVMGRCSDNKLVYQYLGWKPAELLRQGLEETYEWINNRCK